MAWARSSNPGPEDWSQVPPELWPQLELDYSEPPDGRQIIVHWPAELPDD